jgi:hypothetical protein
MKSFYTRLVLALVLIYGSVSISDAQVEKGDNIIGFSGAVSTQASSPSSINSTVLLSYERYISKKIAIGVGPYMTVITSKGGLIAIFGGNVFGNYGFLSGDGKFYPYAGILFSVSQSISTADTRTQQSSTGTSVASGNSTISFFGGGAKVGSKYFLTERVNIDLNVNYSTNFSSVVNGETQDIGTGGILQVFVGVGVIIGKRSGI